MAELHKDKIHKDELTKAELHELVNSNSRPFKSCMYEINEFPFLGVCGRCWGPVIWHESKNKCIVIDAPRLDEQLEMSHTKATILQESMGAGYYQYACKACYIEVLKERDESYERYLRDKKPGDL